MELIGDARSIGHQPMRTGILIKLNQFLQEKEKKTGIVTWNEVYLRERGEAHIMFQW